MRLLGQRTGELHAAFARRTGNPAFEPEPIEEADLASWSTQLRNEAVATLDELEKQLERLTPDIRAAADRLLALRKTLLAQISPAALQGIRAAKMRYHGDYHLGQVLRVENDFIITDFEGEPGRTLAERHQKHSPLRDVAGMLRSFSYVSAVAANQSTSERPADRHRVGPLVRTWELEVGDAFLKGYQAAVSGIATADEATADATADDNPDSAWPSAPGAAERLVGFFVIEKALYELRYEMGNRPDWLSIPLFSLIRTLDAEGKVETN